MQMSLEDLAFMKGEASASAGDTSDHALQRASEHGYLIPGPPRDAFVAGYLNAVAAANQIEFR